MERGLPDAALGGSAQLWTIHYYFLFLSG